MDSVTKMLAALRENELMLHILATDIFNSNSSNAELAWQLRLLSCSRTLVGEFMVPKTSASGARYTGHLDLGNESCAAEVKAKYLGHSNPDSDDTAVGIEKWAGNDIRNLRSLSGKQEACFMLCLATPPGKEDKLERVIRAWEEWGRNVHRLTMERIDLGRGDPGRDRDLLLLTILKFDVKNV